jgi:hypothetical protein
MFKKAKNDVKISFLQIYCIAKKPKNSENHNFNLIGYGHAWQGEGDQVEGIDEVLTDSVPDPRSIVVAKLQCIGRSQKRQSSSGAM